MMKHGMRLAFREQGDYWHAYAATTDEMEGALLLGMIPLIAVVDNPRCKRRFMDLMQEVFEVLVKRATGVKIQGWGETRAAPNHERGLFRN